MRFIVAIIFTTSVLFTQPARMGTNNDASAPQLPALSGKFAVGRVSYDWTDPSRPEPLSDKKGAQREVVVCVGIQQPYLQRMRLQPRTIPISRQRAPQSATMTSKTSSGPPIRRFRRTDCPSRIQSKQQACPTAPRSTPC